MKNTEELYELIFEELNEPTAEALCFEILGEAPVIPSKELGLWEVEIASLVLEPGFTIPNAHLRLLRYEDIIYDVELNFTTSSLKPELLPRFVDTLHRFARQLAVKHSITSYYSGLEPAADEETRLFTGSERGPYA